MKGLSHLRCRNHPGREAVAVCTSCGRSFCRECVTEHDERMVCSTCLNQLLRPASSRRFDLSDIFSLGHSLLGIVILWLAFHYLGQLLLSLPSSFHDGTLWHSGFWGAR